LSIRDLDVLDAEMGKEIANLKDVVKKKESLNFASVSQI
jgi:hypothetical protein